MNPPLVTGPIPPYTNPAIQPQFYQPSRFVISDITLGRTTLVTTTEDNNYVVGQLVRLIIPLRNGCYQLNEQTGYVISIPSANQVEVTIDSSQNVNPFVDNVYQSTITNILKLVDPIVGTYIAVISNNIFSAGQSVLIDGVVGMTQVNGNIYTIFASIPSQFNIVTDTSTFSNYISGGTATLQTVSQSPQILAIGDNNSGAINSSGSMNVNTSIPGSYINISPL